MSFPGSSSSSHSLRYFYTGVSEPDQGLPRFIVVGYVDDQLFVKYDSNTRRAQPRAPWIQEKNNSQYWDRETRTFRNFESSFRASLVTVSKSYNHSGGELGWGRCRSPLPYLFSFRGRKWGEGTAGREGTVAPSRAFESV